MKNGLDMDTVAERFQSLRQAHQSETAEDYVEMIADLIAEHGEARVVDLASCMGVSSPTATKVITRLQKEGLVDTKPYRSLHLTEAGQTLAEHCKKRHEIVYDFLISLGIPEDIAGRDAEGIEHHVSKHTLQAFKEATQKNS